MTFSRVSASTLTAIAAAALLTGCSGTAATPQIVTPGQTPSSAIRDSGEQAASTTLARSLNRVLHPATIGHRATRSWMSPEAKSKRLLYISDADTAEVNVYSYPGGKKLVGTLTGFAWPYGMCSDKAGDVYVSDLLSADVVEYAHGGTTPIRTLSAPGAPIGCAIDPSSGNLAVASFDAANPSTGFGGIWIYPNGSSTGTLYEDSTLSYYWPPAYDKHGNLFFEGELGSNNALDELARGSSAPTRISLDQSIGLPAGVQWDGTYVAAADQRYQGQFTTAIYQVSISGTTGTVVNTVHLETPGSCSDLDIIQPLIVHGRRLIGANPQCAFAGYWDYPSGTQTATFFGPPFGAPNGVALSK